MTPNWYRKLEIVGALGFLCLWGYYAVTVFNISKNENALTILAAFIAGLLLADFMSGLVHWFADTWGDETWLIVGPTLIHPFRNHHVDPMSITRHDFLETNGSLLILSALALALGLMADSAGFIVFLFSLVSFVSITNQIHKFAHSFQAPVFFNWISRFGIVLSKTHHENHHSGDQTKAYCITIGLWNPLLDRIGFFFWLESFIEKTTGARPRAHQ